VPCIDNSTSAGIARAAPWIVALAAAVTLGGCSSDGSKAPMSSADSRPTDAASASADASSTTFAAAATTARIPAAVTLPAPGPDGSIKRIGVLRYPRQAKDTTQLAIDAVRRAAPFGDVSKLSRPWKFSETFLFNDDRQFKPRSLE
jgi:hypothetical protein